jgi:DNA repair exonuclease SbcCD ATPase subunit
MESEAYKYGNGLYFRDWEDSLKNGLEETNYKHITGDTHKMATYDQLKEEITAKVVAALSEKLTNKVEEEAKPDFLDLDGDGDKEEPMKKAAKEKELKKEEEEIEERKKRDTPRDSDRREAEKLKMNEEEQLDEMHCSGKRHDDLKPGERCPMCGYVVMAEGEEDLEEMYQVYDHGGNLRDTDAEQAQYEKAKKEKEEEEKRKAAFNSAKFQRENEELEEAQEEKVVEEAISNDQWYQNELFESLKKRWTK